MEEDGWWVGEEIRRGKKSLTDEDDNVKVKFVHLGF